VKIGDDGNRDSVTHLQMDLQSRYASAVARYERACAVIERSQRLILWSRALMRPGSRIRGGSDDGAVIRARLRALIDAGTLPSKPPTKMFAGPAFINHPCTVCGAGIRPGETKYESDVRTRILRVHRRCYELWREVEAQSV
jgi:hypothetical protein